MYSEKQNTMIFQMGDLLGTDLYEVDGVIRGLSNKVPSLKGFGWPVPLPSEMICMVEEVNETIIGAVARIRKNLWLYALITEHYQGLLFFDGARATIRVGQEKEFLTGNVEQTITKLVPFVVAQFELTDGSWVRVNHKELTAKEPDAGDHLEEHQVGNP